MEPDVGQADDQQSDTDNGIHVEERDVHLRQIGGRDERMFVDQQPGDGNTANQEDNPQPSKIP